MTGKARRPRRQALGAVLAALVVGATTAVVSSARSDTDTETVGEIDGHQISRAEVALHMELLRPDVQNRIQVSSGDTGRWSWEQQIDGEVPLHALQDEAVKQLTRDKQVFVLAEELGVVDLVNHDDLVRARERDNAERTAAVEAGEVVHGLVNSSLSEFYTSTLTNVETQVKRTLSADPASSLHVTQDDIEEYYDADPAAWAAGVASYDVRRLSVPFEGPEALDELTRELDGEQPLEKLADSVPGAVISEVTLDATESAPMAGPLQQVHAQLATLAAGERTDPVAVEGRLAVYELRGKEVDRDDALAMYASRIREAIVAERFDELLAERMSQSSVDFDREAVRSIQMKELQQ